MFVFKLSFILLCACAVNGLLENDFEQNDLDNLDTGLFDSREHLDTTLPLLPAVGRLPRLRKFVSQLEAFVKFAKKLTVEGLKDQVKDLLHETTFLAKLALRLATEENLSAPLLRALNAVYRLAVKLEHLDEVVPARQLYEELHRLYYDVKTAEYLLHVPVLPGYPTLPNDLERY